jgi:hypothetical protein
MRHVQCYVIMLVSVDVSLIMLVSVDVSLGIASAPCPRPHPLNKDK